MKRPREYTMPELAFVSLVVWVVGMVVAACIIASRGL